MSTYQPLIAADGSVRQLDDPDGISAAFMTADDGIFGSMVVGGGSTSYDTTVLIDETVNGSGYKHALIIEGNYTSNDSSTYGVVVNPSLNPGNFDSIRVLSTFGYAYVESGDTMLSAVGIQVGGISKTGTGNIGTVYGLYVSEQSKGDDNYSIYVAGGNSAIAKDDAKLLFGLSKNASLYYDGTDFICNPQEVGSGDFKVLGNIVCTGSVTIDDWVLSGPTAAEQLLLSTGNGVTTWLPASADAVLTVTAAGEVEWTAKPNSWDITSLQITQWDTAYSWGDHAGLYDTVGTANTAVSDHESTYNHGSFGFTLGGPTADNQILQATGVDTAAWTTDIEGLTSLQVDNLTLNGNTISSDGTLHVEQTVNGSGTVFGLVEDLHVISAGNAYGHFYSPSLLPGVDGGQARGRQTEITYDPGGHTLAWAIGEFMGLYESGSGSATNSAAYYVSTMSTGTSGRFALYCFDHIAIAADNRSMYFGAAKDAALYYDGYDLIASPQLSGSGRFRVDGSAIVDDYVRHGTRSGNDITSYKRIYTHYNPVANFASTMKLRLPFGWTNVMFHVRLRGYNYSVTGGKEGAWEAGAGAYPYSPTDWYAEGGYIIGNAPFDTIRLAYDGTAVCLLLGDTATRWAYPMIEVELMVRSFDADKVESGSGNWDVDYSTDEDADWTLTDVVTCPVQYTSATNIDTAPTAANQILQATGAGTASWTADVEGLTSLEVDNLTLDDNSIASDTGTVLVPAILEVYEATSGKSGYLYVAGSGSLILKSDVGEPVSAESDGSYVYLKSGSSNHQYFDCGGNFYWRDVDDSSESRMTLSSESGTLSLYDSGGTTSVRFIPGGDSFIANNGGLTVGDDGSLPGVKFNVVGDYAGSNYYSQINLSTTADTYGMTLGATNTHGAISVGGQYYNSGDWWARQTTVTTQYHTGASIRWYIDSGLTVNTTFTPTEIMRLDGDGLDVTGDLTVNGISVTENIQIGGSDACRVLGSDTTIYVRTTGNDSNGGYTSNDAFATVNRAVIELYKWVADGYTITIDIGEGTFNEASALQPTYAYGSNLVVEGVAEQHTVNCAVTNITSESSLITGLEYIDFDITLPVGYTSAVGQYIICKAAAGGTNSIMVLGCHEVVGWNSGTRKATVRCVRRAGVDDLPSGAINLTDIVVVKTVLSFSSGHGIKVTGAYHGGAWNKLVLEGNTSGTGVWCLAGASLSGGSWFGTSKWATNIKVQNNANFFGDYTTHSYSNGALIQAQNGGLANLRYGCVLSGSKTYGIQCFIGATVSAYGAKMVTAGATAGVSCYQGAFVEITNATMEGVDSVAGAIGCSAFLGGGIDASSTTISNYSSQTNAATNGYVIHP